MEDWKSSADDTPIGSRITASKKIRARVDELLAKAGRFLTAEDDPAEESVDDNQGRK